MVVVELEWGDWFVVGRNVDCVELFWRCGSGVENYFVVGLGYLLLGVGGVNWIVEVGGWYFGNLIVVIVGGGEFRRCCIGDVIGVVIVLGWV